MEEHQVLPAITQDILREKAENYLKNLLSSVIKLPAHRIEADAPMEKYGINSIMVMKMTNELEKPLGSLPKTLFFEYQNIQELTGYFLNFYRDQLIELLGIKDEAAAIENINEPAGVIETVKPAHGRHRRSRLDLHAESRQEKDTEALDIAIIGVSGRYAQAKNIHEYWNNLKEGRNCISEIPKDRWDWEQYYDEEKGKIGSIYSKWGGFLEDIDKFDPLFFHISPKEAEQMDPQERLLLQEAYASIEDAGYTPSTLSKNKRVGVFVGVMNGNYSSGSKYWSIANRLSYLLDFQGPSLAVDTACSSSLTALHLAVESMYKGNIECAIAGGVNLVTDPMHYIRLSAMTMLSSGDECKSFGDKADGFVDGEGVGAIVLKPLPKAIADGDHIYGIIKGSMLNAGGKTNGYTVPNPNAQAQVIEEALKEAGIDPRAISYIEAHGTGTSLGDPIEIAGLTKAFEKYTQDNQYCAIGSAKSNIGHCESASGIAGVTKVLMQLKHRQLVPSLHSKVLNPNIDFNKTPFIVQQELTEWKRPVVEINGEKKEYPRIAGISSFGAGGSNAHVIVEEYIPQELEQPQISVTPRNPAIIVLSAKKEERLKEKAQQLLTAIKGEQYTDANLADMAYTLQVGREAMEERLALTVGSLEELEKKLQGFVDKADNIEDLYRGEVKRNKDTLAIFTSDEDMLRTIEAWISKKKYNKLLDLWVKGLNFDWNKLYGDIKPRRISLPTYPFASERYWIPINNELSDVHDLHELSENNLTTEGASAPTTPVEKILAGIWSEVLGINNLGIDDNYFDLGGNSIGVIRMLAKAFPYNLDLTARDLFQYPTIRQLADKISGATIENEADVTEIDIVVRKHRVKAEEISLRRDRFHYNGILLTGATGYLGIHILKEILHQTDAKVYCMVRGDNDEIARNRLLSTLRSYYPDHHLDELIGDRIFVIKGDVSLEKMGLSEEAYEELGKKINGVIHTAAIIKFFGEYSDFQKTNVLGTQQVINFSKEFDLRFNHISTYAVSGAYIEQGNQKKNYTENDFYIGQKFMDNVYVRSKFEAENLVFKAINEGLDAVIYRVGILTGRYSDGQFQLNIGDNADYNRLKSIIQLGVVPEYILDNAVEFTPVDICSEAIVQLACLKETQGQAFHLFNHRDIKLKDLIRIFGKLGYPIQSIDNNAFLDHIRNISQDLSRQEILNGIINEFDRDGQLHYFRITVDSSITQEYLRQVGFTWPEVNRDYITKIIQHMETVGYIEKLV